MAVTDAKAKYTQLEQETSERTVRHHQQRGLFRLGTKIFCVSHRICQKDVGRGF